jgi:hypothetical protein
MDLATIIEILDSKVLVILDKVLMDPAIVFMDKVTLPMDKVQFIRDKIQDIMDIVIEVSKVLDILHKACTRVMSNTVMVQVMDHTALVIVPQTMNCPGLMQTVNM